VFVLSSIFEGLPGVLIQALACGCAVVSTDCPHGPREILDNGKYGTLVPVGDVQALAEAMANALQEKTHDHSLQNWLRQFELDTALDKYINLLFGESN
jgi:glycosyltransferase involved in cell wall biosynthesis